MYLYTYTKQEKDTHYLHVPLLVVVDVSALVVAVGVVEVVAVDELSGMVFLQKWLWGWMHTLHCVDTILTHADRQICTPAVVARSNSSVLSGYCSDTGWGHKWTVKLPYQPMCN